SFMDRFGVHALGLTSHVGSQLPVPLIALFRLLPNFLSLSPNNILGGHLLFFYFLHGVLPPEKAQLGTFVYPWRGLRPLFTTSVSWRPAASHHCFACPGNMFRYRSFCLSKI